MSSVIIAGNTSGTITLDAPNVAGTTTLTLPTTSGTIVTSASSLTASQMPTGSVLQVVQTTTNSTATYVRNDYITVLQTSITPSSASNKILMIVNFGSVSADTNADLGIDFYRGATQLTVGSGASNTNCTYIPAMNLPGTNSQSSSFMLLDSPSSTSSIDYKVRCMINSGRTMYLNRRSQDTTYACISSVILMEIKG